jgi:hypothetical protein
VRAATCHVVTPLGPLDEHMAFWTSLPILEVLLEVRLASTSVLGQLAFFTESCSASWAFEGTLGGVHNALAVSRGAQSEIRVVYCLLPKRVSLEAILRLFRQSIEDSSFRIERLLATLLGAGYITHGVDLINCVGVEAS